MSRWVLDFLKLKEDSIDSIKDELVPLLVSKQYAKMRNRMGAPLGGSMFRGDESMDESQMSIQLDSMLSEISCHLYIHHGVCSRAMNLPAFVRLNDAVLSGDFAAACGGSPGTSLTTGLHRFDTSCASSSSLLLHRYSLPKTSLFARSKDGSPDWNVPPTMMDKDKHNLKNVKRCVVGEGCKIHESAKLTNCIVMRNVTVMENAVLDVGILCFICVLTRALTFPRPFPELHFVRPLRCSRQLQIEKVRYSTMPPPPPPPHHVINHTQVFCGRALPSSRRQEERKRCFCRRVDGKRGQQCEAHDVRGFANILWPKKTHT